MRYITVSDFDESFRHEHDSSQELLARVGTVQGRLFVEVARNGLHVGQVQRDVPPHTSPDRDQDDRPASKVLVGQPWQTFQADADEELVDVPNWLQP